MARKLDVKYVSYYTSGSAAREIQPAFPVAAPPKPRKRQIKRLKIYIDPVAILGILVAVSMLISMAVGISRLRSAQKETMQMQAYVEQLTQRNEALRQEYKDSYTLAEVKQTALAMGMIPQEEVPRVPISVSVPEVTEQVTLWERIGTFLTGLFA